ncbi:hypothetical protein B0F90DRAFT_1778020 [Multifurca ochricompacta]|uniref:Uncharacterized protein n=1 Tax=Multifurca ochricompacta TaxID=376703 RepID=A0AAD4LV30_9AGAM|nr:hypothetical protein B0F90DRAFT_1778020 [Multifurca ochricompacta]
MRNNPTLYKPITYNSFKKKRVTPIGTMYLILRLSIAEGACSRLCTLCVVVKLLSWRKLNKQTNMQNARSKIHEFVFRKLDAVLSSVSVLRVVLEPVCALSPCRSTSISSPAMPPTRSLALPGIPTLSGDPRRGALLAILNRGSSCGPFFEEEMAVAGAGCRRAGSPVRW